MRGLFPTAGEVPALLFKEDEFKYSCFQYLAMEG
jgi:hypothetical protein